MYQGSARIILEVSCTDPNGCFQQIHQAIETATAGTTIRIGPGTYYEKPLIIDKNLVLQGAGANFTQIHAVDPGPAITVRGSQALDVTLQGLNIVTPHVWELTDLDKESMGIQWVQQDNERAQNKHVILIKESIISSRIGIQIHASQGSITIEQSKIISGTGILVDPSGEINVTVENNSFLGPLKSDSSVFVIGLLVGPAIGVSTHPISNANGSSPSKVRISLRKNEITDWLFGVSTIGAGMKIEVLLEENTISFNKEAAIALAGNTDIEMNRNKIQTNDYGVKLFLAPCVPIKSQEVTAFKGAVKGKDNEIQSNKKANLCPGDYPWPPGFANP